MDAVVPPSVPPAPLSLLLNTSRPFRVPDGFLNPPIACAAEISDEVCSIASNEVSSVPVRRITLDLLLLLLLLSLSDSGAFLYLPRPRSLENIFLGRNLRGFVLPNSAGVSVDGGIRCSCADLSVSNDVATG